MIKKPVLAELPPTLTQVQARWLALGREENGRKLQAELYAREFAEPFARLFENLPLYGAPQDMQRPRVLMSVLGLSWQPVALMAAWCKPERMVVLGTGESLTLAPLDENLISLIARVAGIMESAIEAVRIDDTDETDIYRAIRDFMRRSGVPSREVFVDLTGGKKSMSASAALAGFIAGEPLVYVDYGEYDGFNRIPVPGTEFPRLLTNPLKVLGDLELRYIFAAFERSDFQEAGRLAERLAERLYEPRETECLAKLACGYGAWDHFNFIKANEALSEGLKVIESFGDRGKWTWVPGVQPVLERNVKAVETLVNVPKRPESIEVGVKLLVWYLAAAQRLLNAGKPSLALLLTYAAVERYVNLCLRVDFDINDERPDYSRVARTLDTDKYHEAGRVFFGKHYKQRGLDGPLMFANGAQLLAALSPERLELTDLGSLKGLSSDRNKCEYEHGFIPQAPSREAAERYLEKTRKIVARICGGEDALENDLEDFRFPNFETGDRWE